MPNFIYFSAEPENAADGPSLALGFGFTREGRWRPLPLPRAEALAVDDRFLPAPAGLRQAEQALRAFGGLVVLDFERPLRPELLALADALQGFPVAVPPAYAGAPHMLVLVGPYAPGVPYHRWLLAQKETYGPVLLDLAPIRHLAAPGRQAAPCAGPLPEGGRYCAGAVCLYGLQPDGSVLFWDSRQTLLQRWQLSDAPALALRGEWKALPER